MFHRKEAAQLTKRATWSAWVQIKSVDVGRNPAAISFDYVLSSVFCPVSPIPVHQTPTVCRTPINSESSTKIFNTFKKIPLTLTVSVSAYTSGV